MSCVYTIADDVFAFQGALSPPNPKKVFRQTDFFDRHVYQSFAPRLINKNLQNHLNEIEVWCKKWRVVNNANKNAVILFTRRKTKSSGSLSLDARPNPWRDKASHHDLNLNSTINFKEHLVHATHKATVTLNRLLPLIRAYSDLSLINKLKLYTAPYRPQLTYASPVWTYNLGKRMFHKLQVITNRSLQICTEAPYYVRNDRLIQDLGIPSLILFITIFSAKFS